MDSARPWIVNLELTTACNLRCVFCDHRRLTVEGMRQHDMDSGLLEVLLGQLGNEALHELGLVGLGEPTLDRHLPEHLRIIDRYSGLFDRITLNSNLVALNETVARQLLNSSVNAYTFSLNASNRMTYQELMGRDRFDLALANLRIFLGLREVGGNDVSVSVQLFDVPDNSLDELRRLISNCDHVNFFTRAVYAKPAFQESMSCLQVHRPDVDRRYPCWDIYTRVYIDVDGNVYPCTMGNDSFRKGSALWLGNVSETPLLDLFNGQPLQRARQMAEGGCLPFPECLDCNVWSLTPNNFLWDESIERWTKREHAVRAYGLRQ